MCLLQPLSLLWGMFCGFSQAALLKQASALAELSRAPMIAMPLGSGCYEWLGLEAERPSRKSVSVPVCAETQPGPVARPWL